MAWPGSSSARLATMAPETGSSAAWLARSVRDAEAGGSNPPFPTRKRAGQGGRADQKVRSSFLVVPDLCHKLASSSTSLINPRVGPDWPCHASSVSSVVPPTARHIRVAVRRGQFGGGGEPASARAYHEPVHMVTATSISASTSIKPSRCARSRMSRNRRRRGATTWSRYVSRTSVSTLSWSMAPTKERRPRRDTPFWKAVSSATRSPNGSVVSGVGPLSVTVAMAAAASSDLSAHRR